MVEVMAVDQAMGPVAVLASYLATDPSILDWQFPSNTTSTTLCSRSSSYVSHFLCAV